MTQRCVASTGSGAMISGHHVPTQSAAPTYAAVRPVYIGLRLIRYGPLVTSVDTGWCGTTVVRLRRKVAAPDPLSASPAIVRTAPTAVVTAAPAKATAAIYPAQALRRRVAAGQGRRKQVYILGRSIHQIMGEHRATTGQCNLPGLRQRERDRRDLLMPRVQTHDATTPSRGSQTCRRCGGSHKAGPQPQQLLMIDISAHILRRPIRQHNFVHFDALRFVGHVEGSSGPLGQTRTHPGATAPPRSAGRATLPGRRAARPDAANHPGAVPKPTSSCGTSSRLKTSTSHSPALSSSPPASTPPSPSPTRPRGPARRRRPTARVAAGSRATPSHQTTPGAAAPRPGLMLTGCVPMPAVAGASLGARLFYASMEERAPGGSPSKIPLSVPDGRSPARPPNPVGRRRASRALRTAPGGSRRRRCAAPRRRRAGARRTGP